MAKTRNKNISNKHEVNMRANINAMWEEGPTTESRASCLCVSVFVCVSIDSRASGVLALTYSIH